MKADKLPWIDPNVRGVFDVIIATAASVRKQRKSDEYKQSELRREAAARVKREADEVRAKHIEEERKALIRLRAAQVPRAVTPFLMLEADDPRFVR